MNRVAIALLLIASTAHADVVFMRQELALGAVTVTGAAADEARVRRQVRGSLARALTRCTLGQAPRGSLSGELVFASSARASVTFEESQLPPPMRSCLERAARGVTLRPAPSGEVRVRFTFALRAVRHTHGPHGGNQPIDDMGL